MENAMPVAPVERLVGQPLCLPLDSIVCGDNCDVLGTFPRECIDLVVTSPPYDNLRTYGGHSWDFESVAQQLWRVIKPGGVVVWVVADATVNGSETGTSFRQALRFMEIGFRLHDTMIWLKDGVACHDCGNKRYKQQTEYMFILGHGAPVTYNDIRDVKTKHGGKTLMSHTKRREDGSMRRAVDEGRVFTVNEFSARSNVWLVATEKSNAPNHPAPFPEALARDHILSWSNEGDIVLDPFNGSGTTTKMARLMGRRFIGIDVNESYCEIARKRLAQKLLDFDAAG